MMSLRNTFLSTIGMVFFTVWVSAQADFFAETESVLGTDLRSGVAVAVGDVDGDHFDDLIYPGTDGRFYVSLYRGSSSKYQQQVIDELYTGGTWSIVVGDVDANGLTDIVTASLAGVTLYSQESPMQFATYYVYDFDWLPQASNLVDYDNDGDLDYFLCNDDGLNILLNNDGAGQFTPGSSIDFSTVPVSDNSGNYSSIWTDIDADGDQDLYIAKCRAGVTDPTDPRRINVLYINNGDGTYTEAAADYGLADGLQSWSVDAADIDNDGDVDLFVTNHDGPHILYINEQDTFVSYPYMDVLLESFAFQGVMHDMDNNGWLDIVVTDGKDNLILYNDEMTFVDSPWQSYLPKARSAIVHDVNQDGFLDIWAQGSRDFLASAIGKETDEIWINSNDDNHWITFRLYNKDRILAGAKAVLFSGDVQLSRFVHLGSSYGQQESSHFHFGLGDITSLDSLVITWIDGTRYHQDLSEFTVDDHYVTDGVGCLTTIERPDGVSSKIICPDSEVTVASELGAVVNWTTGDQAADITLTEEASVAYTYVDADGCLHISDYLTTVADSAKYNLDTYGWKRDTVHLCEGEVYVLSWHEGASYMWSNGATGMNILAQESGIYNVTVTSDCGVEYSNDPIVIEVLQPVEPQVTGDTVEIGQSAILLSDTPETRWYDGPFVTDTLAVGASYTTPPLSGDTYYYANTLQTGFFLSGSVGELEGPSESQYSNNSLAGAMEFDVYSPVHIKSIAVETDTEGVRQVVIKGESGEDVYRQDFMIDTGRTVLELDVVLQEGSYSISTDVGTNFENFGHNGPRLSRIQSTEVLYPYDLSVFLSLVSSSNGQTRYFYFYDWQVDYDFMRCFSSRSEAYVKVNGTSTVSLEPKLSKLYPNPAKSLITIESMQGVQRVELYDITGSKLDEFASNSQTKIELSLDYPPGSYTCLVYNVEGTVETHKISIVK